MLTSEDMTAISGIVKAAIAEAKSEEVESVRINCSHTFTLEVSANTIGSGGMRCNKGCGAIYHFTLQSQRLV